MTGKATALERILANQLKKMNIFNAVIAVASGDDSFAWSGGAGIADPATNAVMDAQTPYQIASVTKIFTATAVMLLLERGELRLEDPVSRFVDEGVLEGLHRLKGVDHGQDLEIHHLLGHTSGLADYFEEKDHHGRNFVQTLAEEGDADWTRDDLLDLVREDLEPKFKPAPAEGGGQKAHYSDTNYQLLGSVVEHVTQQRFGQALHDLLFEPFGLSETYVFGADVGGHDRKPVAVIFRADEPLVIPKAMKAFGPNGGMVSTAGDQIAFLKALFQGRIFERADTLERMQQWNKIFFPVQYGYGLMKYALPRWMSPFQAVPRFIGHSGSIGSFAFYSADRDLYVAGTVNQVQARAVPFRLMPKIAQAVA